MNKSQLCLKNKTNVRRADLCLAYFHGCPAGGTTGTVPNKFQGSVWQNLQKPVKSQSSFLYRSKRNKQKGKFEPCWRGFTTKSYLWRFSLYTGYAGIPNQWDSWKDSPFGQDLLVHLQKQLSAGVKSTLFKIWKSWFVTGVSTSGTSINRLITGLKTW